MRHSANLGIIPIAALLAFGQVVAAEDVPPSSPEEAYVHVPMPPGFQVIVTELEGPVFADTHGKTLYEWPLQNLRDGYVGDEKNSSNCTDQITRKGAGLMSPYPPGLVLPELDTRPSCVDMWPPVLAAPDAKPIGSWTLIARKDGTNQWGYEGQALYTSALDQMPGDVRGATSRHRLGETAPRRPVGPPPNVPPGFMVATTARGRLLVDEQGFSVYASDKDGPDKSNCHADCADVWLPKLAPALAQPQREWTIIERAPGARQWTFRQQPLYTYSRDVTPYSQQGSDVSGWYNLYTQRTPDPPKPFTFHDTQSGVVVADAKGMTVYVYNCSDDSLDQLSCDYPGAPPVYRLAICGGGSVERCLKTWPYVTADPDAKSNSRAWSVIEIDPRTGHLAAAGQSGTLRVWAYRGRPVYTCSCDDEPGDIKGNSRGEYSGGRNGFRAFWVRDDFFQNDT